MNVATLRAFASVVLLVLGPIPLVSPSTAVAQSARIELHPLPTTTLTDKQFLTGTVQGKADVVAAGVGRLITMEK